MLRFATVVYLVFGNGDDWMTEEEDNVAEESKAEEVNGWWEESQIFSDYWQKQTRLTEFRKQCRIEIEELSNLIADASRELGAIRIPNAIQSYLLGNPKMIRYVADWEKLQKCLKTANQLYIRADDP